MGFFKRNSQKPDTPHEAAAPLALKPAAPEIPPLSVAPEKKSMIGNFFNPKK